MSNVRWSGDKLVVQRMSLYGVKVREAVKQVAEYWGPVLVAEVQRQGKWTDQTGNMRQSVNYTIRELSKDTVVLYIHYGVNYAIFVETMGAGKFATLWPVIEQHLPQVFAMLQGIFK